LAESFDLSKFSNQILFFHCLLENEYFNLEIKINLENKIHPIIQSSEDEAKVKMKPKMSHHPVIYLIKAKSPNTQIPNQR
jgi:hypothetical protein